MNIREISKPVTAKSLNESLAKKFGKKIALEQFTLEQLQDVRNKIRTTLSQVETNESFNTVQSESYQKNKLFLDVLNAEISERADVVEAECTDCKCTPCECATNEAADGELPDNDGDGVPPWADKDDNDPEVGSEEQEKEKAKKKEPVAESKKVPWKDANGNPQPYLSNNGRCAPGYVLEKASSNSKRPPMCVPEGQVKRKRDVKEGAEDQAELVMASKDMVNRVTSWMEDTAEMQTESMLELADAIRDEQGQQASDAFVQTVKPALESLYSALESTRESLTQGVGQLTGEAEPVADMGTDPIDTDMDMEPTVDSDADLSTSLDAAPAAAGGEEEAGRAKRESIQRKKKAMIETSRRLGTILSKKK